MAMGALSFGGALYLRLSQQAFNGAYDYIGLGTVGFALLLGLTLISERNNRKLWRYVSLQDLLVIARSATVALLVFYVLLFQFTRLENFPRSVVVIHWMTLMFLLMGPRVLWRLYFDHTLIDKLRGHGQMRTSVLLIGAGHEAERFIRESTANPNFPYKVIGILDDDTRHHGRELHHARIYGGTHEAAFVIDKLARKNRKPQRIVLTQQNIPREVLKALLAVAESKRITLARMPSLSALEAGDAQAMEVQPVAVEDILGRPQHLLDRAAMRTLIAGKRVLITGAGGSIGSELVRQVAEFGPQNLVLYELSEFNLYSIDYSIRERFPTLPLVSLVGDVRDATRLASAMRSYTPDIVFHAAALKQVPLSEANPDQAVLTNVLGTRQVAEACVAHHVKLMVQVSTDKAVNPISIMGASKRVAEMLCQTVATKGNTQFVTVRFGNVLNSAGSVVPLFQRQIARGGPITITHPEMERFFMTIAEAVELILQAASLDGKAEHASIYVLEMGEPVKIIDLARQMVRLAGLTPETDIPFVMTGLRPGEKLTEELFHTGEQQEPTAHPSIRRARTRELEAAQVAAQVEALLDAARRNDEPAIREAMQRLVPEFGKQEEKAA
jgi:FlaA1/EpsC-like NDP-sugar epimerase